MAGPLRLRAVRSLVPIAAGPVLETVQEGEPDVRVLPWPGTPPDRLIPARPVLGPPGRQGFINGVPSWMEPCPAGALLSDLPLPLPPLFRIPALRSSRLRPDCMSSSVVLSATTGVSPTGVTVMVEVATALCAATLLPSSDDSTAKLPGRTEAAVGVKVSPAWPWA